MAALFPAAKRVQNCWIIKKPGFIGQQRELLRESDKLNYALWDPVNDRLSNNGELINKDEELTFDEAVDRLKCVLMNHLKVMDGIFAIW